MLCILCFLGRGVFAYDASLEATLRTSPNIDATEYVLIKHNDLTETLIYLQKLHESIKGGNEPEVRKMIRATHLYYLEAYAHLYHESTLSKLKRNKAIFNLIEQVRKLGSSVLSQYKEASDLRRVIAVSMMLMANTGVQGLNKFMNVRRTAIKYAVDALALDDNNPMARVVVNNFDALAIGLIGAKAQRGFAAIDIPVDPQWKKPHVFEFYVSQVFAFSKKRDKESARRAFENARALYPRSWRLASLQTRLK